MLAFDRVSAGYRRRLVCRDVSFALDPGRILGLIGPNGAGKTTLLRVAAGLVRTRSGRVVHAGAAMYFAGEATLPGGSRADRWSGFFGARAGSRECFRRLSRGTRQMVGLRTWLSRRDWDVGLLDEPWEGLDPDGARWLCEALIAHRDRGASLMVSSHRLHDVADACDVFAFLSHGTLRVVDAAGLTSGRVDAAALLRMFDETARVP